MVPLAGDGAAQLVTSGPLLVALPISYIITEILRLANSARAWVRKSAKAVIQAKQ